MFYKQGKKFYLSLHYNESSSYLFVNGVKIHHFKAKDSELNANAVCLGNTSKVFSGDNMKEIGLNGCVYDFSVDFGSIDVDDILDTYKHSMKKLI